MIFDLIRTHQLNIMLALSATAFAIALLLLITRFIPQRRRWILIFLELSASLLLWFDRYAYMYSGDVSRTGYIMVRLSNFMVFFLTVELVFLFNFFIIDLLLTEKITETVPTILKVCGIMSFAGMLMVIISFFTGWYYFFDDQNRYHRGPLFILCYAVPLLVPLLQFSVLVRYRKEFGRFMRIALTVIIFTPLIAAVIQLFAYGLSITNMAMVLALMSLYIFTYLDINDEVERVHAMEMEGLKEAQKSMYRLVEQIAGSFVNAVERRDEFSRGKSARIADISRKIAESSGMDEIGREDVYFAALLHDVGTVSLPDETIKKETGFTDDEEELIRKKPLVSAEILSSINEYPQLSKIARYSYENYDGTGYPEGKKAEEIPAASRIIAVARAYDDMMSPHRTRNSFPTAIVREELVKNSGTLYDPVYADVMVKLMDAMTNDNSMEVDYTIEEEIQCGEYRDHVTAGIEITPDVKKISFRCEYSEESVFSSPSIVVFDSFDRRTHGDEKTIRSLKYLEYAEMWFDGHSILTGAKNMKIDTEEASGKDDGVFVIRASHVDDHMKIRMESVSGIVNAVIALPDKTKSAYIGITGEHCHIREIRIEETGEHTGPDEIPRIAEETSYIDRMESDIPNVQVDRWRSAYTRGIPVCDRLRVDFHSMSLPSANLVWHCPYVVLFHSKDGTVNGEDYREYAMMKTNGESDIENEYSKNRFYMKKDERFPGWDAWQDANRAGMDFKVMLRKKGNRVTIITENLGIYLENVTTVPDKDEDLYLSITGDQVALTDIRVR